LSKTARINHFALHICLRTNATKEQMKQACFQWCGKEWK
jgi:hypothetical protein